MKKNILNNRKLIYFLTMLLAVLMVTSCSANGNYVTNNVLEDKMVEDVNIDNVVETQPPYVVVIDVISKIDDLIEKIFNSPDDCWRKTAQNRKNTMINKLTSLRELILQELFEEAYNKMLHDIKPKLTALKTDEDEIPWGNGTFKQAWVVCEDFRDEFRVDCNTILELISTQPM
ncbi:MAG: hypothetical protein CEE42_15780 [Promethearchaeota archaeon Loki_b31]|nr:MAG: hypothetical protein CEE42_15780 [Candidatus Lokiarchaeota archaeon Loki_b31]